MKTAVLPFDDVVRLCQLALIAPPPQHYQDIPMLLMCKQRQAQAKLKRWERAKNRAPDWKERQAGAIDEH